MYSALPKYKGHKTVGALQIVGIDRFSVGGLLHFAPSHFAAHPVSEDYMEKHNPKIGGYFVVYIDGYESFSPSEAFEEGYTPWP